MSIGNTGRRAKQFGKRSQQRYQLSYAVADQTPLHAVQRRGVNKQPTVKAFEHGTLRSEEATETSETPVAATVEETSPTDSGGASQVDVKAVAERVYALLMEDSRQQRERWRGGR